MSLALYVIFPYLFYNMAKFAEGNYNTDRYIPRGEKIIGCINCIEICRY